MIQKTIVITGTHQSPATELIRQLKMDNTIHWKVYYIGRKYRSTSTKITTTEYDLFREMVDAYITIESAKFHRHSIYQSLLTFPYLFSSIYTSYVSLKQIKPNILVSLGGYISIPVLIAGKLLGIKSIIHEQTLTNSLTTKISSYFVNKVALSFDNLEQIKSLPKDKVVITGNLIRNEILQKSKINILKEYFKNKKPVLYITGGNQGSVVINKILLSILPKLLVNYNIIHQVGNYDYDQVLSSTKSLTNSYVCKDYFPPQQVAAILQQSEIIIGRSGANICHELVALQKKCILIPLSFSQQNEQLKNANWTQKKLGRIVEIIPENNLTGKSLQTKIENIIDIPSISNFQTEHLGSQNFMKLIHETTN